MGAGREIGTRGRRVVSGGSEVASRKTRLGKKAEGAQFEGSIRGKEQEGREFN